MMRTVAWSRHRRKAQYLARISYVQHGNRNCDAVIDSSRMNTYSTLMIFDDWRQWRRSGNGTMGINIEQVNQAVCESKSSASLQATSQRKPSF